MSDPIEKYEIPGPSFAGKWKWMWIAAGVLVVAAIILVVCVNH